MLSFTIINLIKENPQARLLAERAESHIKHLQIFKFQLIIKSPAVHESKANREKNINTHHPMK